MSDERGFLTTTERAVLAAVVDRLVPPKGDHPGGAGGGAVSYIDQLLSAFAVNPPAIHGGGPYSGRAGGDPAFSDFLPLGAREELAWRTRIEGSCGIAEREPNGPVIGFQQRYREGLAALGTDFPACAAAEQDTRLAAAAEFSELVYEHTCESIYGAPTYGGNPNGIVWAAISYPGDTQPVGYTDAEVTGRD